MLVKITKYVFRNDPIRCEISESIIVVFEIFALALNVSEILTFEMLDIEKVGQGCEVLLLNWRHSLANIKFYKDI